MNPLVTRLVPDELWKSFRVVVPSQQPSRPQGGGRRKADDRAVLAGIVFVTLTGCAWRELPPALGPRWQTVYRHFSEWSRASTWERLRHVVTQRRGNSAEDLWVRLVVDSLHERWASY
ncbi:transposase [Streptomyces sp. NPDC057702]|uniref:transposase n=1 Tax=unclassified Streptomyces TaxID=2593676 RepID=UPI0036957055